MRISVSSDMDEPVARTLVDELRARGHEVVPYGALSPGADPQWAVCSEAAAREVAAGTADQAVVCCWTGTGASIAANKVPGVRAALCTDACSALAVYRTADMAPPRRRSGALRSRRVRRARPPLVRDRRRVPSSRPST